MTVYHLALHGSQVQVGQALACEARNHSGWHPPGVADPVRNRARRRWFEHHWPEHYARMAGVAAAFGQQLDDDRVDFANIMAEPVAAHCSAVWCSSKMAAEGHALVGRNLDFTTRTVSEMLGEGPAPGEQPALSRPYVIETHPQEGHPAIVSTVGDLTGCLDGINDQGLMVAVLSDDETPSLHPSGAPQAGLNEMHVLRYLLDTCSDAEEAKEALYGAKQYDEYAVAHYLVADSEQAFVWERETHNAEHAVAADGGTLCVTNYLLYRSGVASVPNDLANDAGVNDAYRRARILQGGLNQTPVTGHRLWELLESVRADRRKDEVDPEARTRTLWHAQYELESRSVGYEFYLGDEVDGAPRRSPLVALTLSV
jgi:Acyl-coenzyme A:6-aminopenicillanic acid acyl-transferase